jgi:multidrug efflux system membrane fusion protein
MKKTTIIILVAVVAIAAIVAGLRFTGNLPFLSQDAAPKPAGGPPAMPPTPVSVAKVMEKPVVEWDEFSGRITAIESVQIRPQVSGTITKIDFQDGQLVKKGDPLFTIDPRPFQAALASAQATLASAQAHLALAQTNHQRNTSLIASHAIAQSDFDATNDALLEANANVQAAQAAVQTAQINLDYTSITAPVAGRVSRAEITLGNLVVGNATAAPVLTTIVSVSPVYVEFDVDEQAYLKYAANGASGNSGIDKIPIAIGLANEADYPHQGRIHSLDNALDTTSGTIRVRGIFDNPTGALVPGLYAKVRVGGSAAQTAILVDDRAIGTDQDKKFVMVIDDTNKANYRMVTLGPIVNGLRVIRSGLKKDEVIVVDGLQRVRPNSIVAPTEVAMDRNVTPPDLTASASAKL